MKSSLPSFPEEGLRFLKALAKNNNRDWFDANKQTFLDKVRTPMEAIVAAVSSEITRFAPAYATEPKRAIFRIYRDTRFSNDKTPYKTHASALFFRHELGKNEAAGFYFEISHKYLGIAGGLYMPSADYLRAVRAHMAGSYERLEKTVRDRSLVKLMGEVAGEMLARPPKGFPPDHPAIEWIKHKQWYYWQELDPKIATTPKVVDAVASRFRKMAPFVEFLNEPLLGLKKKSPVLLDL